MPAHVSKDGSAEIPVCVPPESEALRKVRLARHDGYMERIAQTAADWVPHVRRLRPHMSSPPRADNVATLVGQDAAGTG